MKRISLTKDAVALVDEKDYNLVMQKKWYLGTDGYAYTHISGKHISMHRFLLKAPKDLEVDHINRIKLDNRRRNLRLVTSQQNNWNLDLPKHNSSGFMGVSLFTGNKINKKWRARIKVGGKEKSLGYFYTKEEASQAYLSAKKRLHYI